MLREMGMLKANRQRMISGVVLFVAVCALGLGLLERRDSSRDALGQASYDYLHQLSGQMALGDSPVAIVYLDLGSYGAY